MGPPNQPLHPDALPFGRLWYGEPNAISNAIRYAKFFIRSHNAVIRVYDAAGNVIDPCRHYLVAAVIKSTANLHLPKARENRWSPITQLRFDAPRREGIRLP